MTFRNGTWRSAAVLLFAGVALGSCSRQILTDPELNLTKQSSLTLKPPLALSVIDDEGSERGSSFATKLATSIRDAYGGAVEIVPATATPKAGQVTVRLHIIRLGAYFDPSGHPLETAREVDGDPGDWNDVLEAAESAGPISSGRRYVFLPGDWSGIADVDIELTDLRPGRHAAFTLPLIAERVAPNKFGYLTARSTAGDAWDVVSPQIARFLDATIRKLSAER